MLKSFIWLFKFWGYLLACEPKMAKAKKILKSGDKEGWSTCVYETVKWWGGCTISSTGAKINVYGLENLPKGKNMLFVSNHQSNFDIPLLLSQIPVPKGFVAKKELEKVPFIGRWMKQLRCLFMDRDDMKQSMQIILECIKQLKEGYSMVIFPEGTRSKSNHVAEFKAGSFKPALKAKVPIVPVTIDGTYRLFEGNNSRIGFNKEINLFIHEPIYTENLSKEEINDIHNRVRDMIVSKISK